MATPLRCSLIEGAYAKVYCAEEIQDEPSNAGTVVHPGSLDMVGKKLSRTRVDQLAGFCGGMGAISVLTLPMRVGWVLAAFLSGGLAILAYLVLIFVVPNEPYSSQNFTVRA
jgi:phage shock protein PspC (stress-responsive transcriptional regulator)